jgi:rare lipoprotein A (peptidoglycan hydrolase)
MNSEESLKKIDSVKSSIALTETRVSLSLKENFSYSKIGRASWYGLGFDGKLTANGEIFDMNHLTAAHPTMPLPSYARVTNLRNGSSLVVRVNDRGPFVPGRIIDLSWRAAELLSYQSSGITDVKVDYIGIAPIHSQDNDYLTSSLRRRVPILPRYGPCLENKPILAAKVDRKI